MPLLSPPIPVLDIAARLEARGFEAWCVGGAVRDALLGLPDLDWDLATSATPDQVREIFGHRRTIPVGIEFGTVGVLDRDGRLHEVTTFRRDVRTDGRHAVVEFGVSLEDDLARRDFTINAIAYSPRLDEVRDPFGGRADLERRVVRAVGDPEVRMAEDRLRALRAIRFASRFGFLIDPATMRAIEGSAPLLGRLSPERVKQELDKTMEQVAAPGAAFRLWRDSGAFATLIPALAPIDDVGLAVPDHLAMPGPAARPQRRMLRTAGLLSALDSRAAGTVLTQLRASRQEISWTTTIVERWHRLRDDMTRTLMAGIPDDRTLRRWLAAIGRLNVGGLMRLACAVWAAERAHGIDAPSPAAVRAVYRRLLAARLRDPIEIADLAIDGDDLRRTGIPPGPDLGRILHALLDAVLDDPALNRTDWLLQEAQRLHAAPSGATVRGEERRS